MECIGKAISGNVRLVNWLIFGEIFIEIFMRSS